MNTNTTVIYVDMDHVLCDYDLGYKAHKAKYPDLPFPQSQPGLYINLLPIKGAVETFNWLSQQPEFSVYILTAPSMKNPHCYSEKRQWVEKYLGMPAVNNLIISAHKGLNRGDYLIDDCASGKGQENFEGQLIQFGSTHYPDWSSVRTYFEKLL
ncbi:MAG: 5'-nucleotidase [Candidatus Endobugula sp.]|jgi:5'-nucleotidase